MVKIEYNMENMKKCVCNVCPVQAKSECAQKVFKMMPEMMKKGEMPDPKKFTGLYCATGTTMCGDLDYDKMCNCPSCPIYQENNLSSGEPGGYYCKNGEAK